MATKQKENDYDASSIVVLEGLEAVRHRMGMYVGGEDEVAFHHLAWEIIDNSIDEAMAGHCSLIEITINKGGSLTVQDNGRGIPVKEHPVKKISAATLVVTELHAGGKMHNGKENSGYKTSGGLNGVGASVTNALSALFEMKIERDGYEWNQIFENGGSQVDILKKGAPSNKTGTMIRFKPDSSCFSHSETGEPVEWDASLLSKSLEIRSYLNPGLKINFLDQRDDQAELICFYAENYRDIIDIVAKKDAPFFIPVIEADETVSDNEKGDVQVMLALRYHSDRDNRIASYCNNIVTPNGGTHESGFRSALLRVINNYGLKERGILKEPLTAEDVREGLYAAISVRVGDPKFKGQTKDQLANPECNGAVSSVTYKAVMRFFEENPKEAKELIKKAERSSKARKAADKARQMVERKNPLGGSALPGKLADCQSSVPAECELYIVEGDSAGGSAKQGRERFNQAILPLKGKPLNVRKSDLLKALKSDEIDNIVQVLGCGTGANFDEEKLKYHKIIIMTDADVDGEHIITLLLTLIHDLMPRLIEQGYIYIAMPPLYRLKKGKDEVHWIQNDEDLDAFFIKNDKTKFSVQRFKGLGEMNPEQLWDTTMNPETRTLMRIKYTEDCRDNDESVFDLLMGKEVEPRRAFIEENAQLANID